MQRTLAPIAACLAFSLAASALEQPTQSPASPAAFVQKVPGTTATLDMLPVPTPDGRGTIWFSKTEITWDLYDVFVYSLDEEDAPAADGSPPPAPPDAVTRPSRPYIPPDRGYGHSGYPAISMSAHGAQQFCIWLSQKTGRTYRLPTEAEWEHACRAGATSVYGFGDDAAMLPEFAWFAANAGAKTHPIASKHPNVLGLHDLHGNVAEWTISPDGKPVARGGSFLDDAAECRCDARRVPDPSWNASDPQFPKSTWWLADAPFIGFRIVCEPEPADADQPQP